MRERVVITGIGCVSSLGVGVGPFVEGLLAGRSGVTAISSFNTDGCRSHTAAQLLGFDAGQFIPPLKLRRMDEIGRLALAACRLAVEDARLPAGSDRVGVVIGSATAGLHSTIGHMHVLATAGPAAAPALTFSNTVGNSAASLCAIEFGLRGPNVTFAQKQASSLAALAYSVEALRDGRAQGFVTGGVDDFEERFFKVHDRFGVLSPSGGGDEASRPFDRRRNGYVLGAGGHLFVLESASAAGGRGADVLGEILGVGSAAAPCGLNNWPTSCVGAVRAMRQALADAALEPAAVDVVFAAANGTDTLDRTEAQAIEEVFGPCAVPVSAVKGALGEYGGAAGGAVTAALCGFRQGRIPPTVGCEQLDPRCRVDLDPAARPARGPVALVNATAAGGSHYSLLIRSFGPGEFERGAGIR